MKFSTGQFSIDKAYAEELECGMLEGKIQLAVWFQNRTELKHYDARFSWKGTAEEFSSAVHYLAVANDVQRKVITIFDNLPETHKFILYLLLR